MRILNLYAGLGGNRKHWQGHSITSVELDPQIANVYAKLHPNDALVIGDAHEYLLNHFQDFDMVWSSPPCQSHSRMIRSGRNRKPRYPDMSLYEEILFLKHTFEETGKVWVVENVIPYYKPMLDPQRIGRHLFWSNVCFDGVEEVKSLPNLSNANQQAFKDWLDIHYEGSIYYGNNHEPAQVLRNCVHPLIGRQCMSIIEETN